MSERATRKGVSRGTCHLRLPDQEGGNKRPHGARQGGGTELQAGKTQHSEGEQCRSQSLGVSRGFSWLL